MAQGVAAHFRNSGFYTEMESHQRGFEQMRDIETEWS